MNALRFAKWACAVIVAVPFLIIALVAGLVGMMGLAFDKGCKSAADYILPKNITPYEPYQ